MRIFTISENLEVRKSSVSGRGVFATSDIEPGEVLIDIEATIVSKPSKFTLQTGENTYLLAEYIDNTINHSCDPNVRVQLYRDNPNRVSYIAIKKIPARKEIFWNYNTTEQDMGRGFKCKCGSKKCIGVVRGMKYLVKSFPHEKI